MHNLEQPDLEVDPHGRSAEKTKVPIESQEHSELHVVQHEPPAEEIKKLKPYLDSQRQPEVQVVLHKPPDEKTEKSKPSIHSQALPQTQIEPTQIAAEEVVLLPEGQEESKP